MNKSIHIRNDDFEGKFAFDEITLNNSNPIVFSSKDGYTMSRYAYNQTHKAFGGEGLDLDFFTLGSEGALSEYIQDMYSQRLPFLVIIYRYFETLPSFFFFAFCFYHFVLYSPHTDFATPLNDSTDEIMEYQRIAFPRNPSNNVADPCYLRNECMSPLTELRKIGNARLYHTFPEMVTWAASFKMTMPQVATVAEIYSLLSGENKANSYGWAEKDMWFVF